jgi:hypothetical protein
MFSKGIVTVGAALVLASCLAATDASAARRAAQGVRNPANAGGQKASASRVSPSSNTNFGLSGPYVGLKFIGKQ